MNLIVFTPANTKSAIGRMAALVTRELTAQGCHVTVVRTEAKDMLSTEIHDFGALVVPWDDEAQVQAFIQGADAGIYQIGDNFQFHEGALHWLASFPGLVCLHDFFLGHLFYGWAQTYRKQADFILQRWYGDQIAERFFGFPDSESFIKGTVDVAPLTEWICSQATGVITHSRWGCDRVLLSCPGHVRVVPLAYDAVSAAADAAISAPVHTADDGGTLRLLTIGHVNPNKRVASVIEAIGRSVTLKQRVTYRLVGAVQPEVMRSLLALATRLGVTLIISGEVDESALTEAVMESEVVSCLRWPALEAASASAIEAMLYGKAIIVTDTGFYAEVPDACAIKIAPDKEIEALQAALEALLQDKMQVRDMGAAAQGWALQTFTAENYARQVIDVVGRVARTAPAQRAVEHFGGILRQWSAAQNLFHTAELTNPLRIFEKSA